MNIISKSPEKLPEKSRNLDLAFVKAYKAFVLQFNSLIDHGKTRFCNEELEAFWNQQHRSVISPATGRWIYQNNELTLKAITAHVINQGEKTLWVTNRYKPVIWLKCDIDAKNGEDDAHQHADAVASQLGGFVEPSTGGHGRHVYFKLDIDHIKLEKVAELIKRLRTALAIHGQQFRSKFDRVLGSPTIWTGEVPEKRIVERGTPWKLPFCGNGLQDLHKLEGLPVQRFWQIAELCDRLENDSTDCSIPSRYLGRTKPRAAAPEAESALRIAGSEGQPTDCSIPSRYLGRTKPEDRAELDGLTKKQQLVSQQFRSLNETPELEQTATLYESEWFPSGMTAQDQRRRRSELRSIIKAFSQTFVSGRPSSPYSFKPNAYLAHVHDNVPDEAFNWSRREKIDHQRLADFVGIKIQDAFTHKAKFKAKTSRNATLANIRAMKAKGLVHWTCGPNQYARLLKIATAHGLLRIYEDHIPPVRNGTGKAVFKGVARMIGPGPALPMEYAAFQPIYEAQRVPEYLLALVAA